MLLARAVAAARPGGTARPPTCATTAADLDAARDCVPRHARPSRTPFAVLVHNAGLDADDAEVLALAAAVEADPGRQLVVAHLHGDNVTTRATLHLLGLVFPGDHTGVRAVGPEAPLRAAALVDVAGDGPWSTHAVVVHPAVMWALAGDTSPDPDLPFGAELRRDRRR